MAAAGIPLPREDHVEAIAEMALEMLPDAERCAAEIGLPFDVRIGIDTGPVVASVIGRSKFIYDLWGDTVNTASRMESHAPPGAIQVTARIQRRLRRAYHLEPRGPIDVKGKGRTTAYLARTARREHRSAATCRRTGSGTPRLRRGAPPRLPSSPLGGPQE